MTTPQTPAALGTVTYTVHVPIIVTTLSGNVARTGVRHVQVEEERSIFGCLRATDKAIAAVQRRRSGWLESCSPEPVPNAAELGWPLGTPSAS